MFLVRPKNFSYTMIQPINLSKDTACSNPPKTARTSPRQAQGQTLQYPHRNAIQSPDKTAQPDLFQPRLLNH